MAISLNGTTGITTPGITNTGAETVVDLTTTGNTILGDASGDTLTVTGGTTTFTQGTANGVAFLNGSKVLTTGSANLTFNGTTLTANTIGAFTLGGTIAGGGNNINNVVIGASSPLAGNFTTLTTSSTVTHNGGTANGVAYLNGSKVLTTGSALTFDGTRLSITSANAASYLILDAPTDGGYASFQVGAATFADVGSFKGIIGTGSASDLYIGTRSTNNLIFGTAFIERMRLTSAGLAVTGTLSATSGYNGTVGATTPGTGVFTALNTSGIITITIPGTGIPTNLAVNTTAGAANGMSIEARADESSGIRLVQTSTTYNTSPTGASDPPNIASAGTLVSGRNGGLNIVGANGPVRTYSGGVGTATTSVSSTGLAVTGRISVSGTNPSIQQTVQNAFLDLCGGTTVGTDPSIQIAGSTTTSDANKIFYNANAHVFRPTSGASTYAIIDSSGNLLVGGASQTAGGEKFLFQNYVDAYSAVAVGISAGAIGNKDLNFYSNGNSQFFTAARIRVCGGQAYTDEGFMSFWTTSNDGANVLTTSEKMRIKADGSVGIGTSLPTQKLTVLSTSGTYGTAYQPIMQIANSSSGGTLTATGLGAIVWSTDGTLTPVASIEAVRESPGSGAASALYFRTGSSGGGTTRAVIDSSGNLTISNGNLIIGTAGKGIDFSATASGSGTMTSELLADYEEGTWTPSVGGDATYTTQAGRYTKIGNIVYIQGQINIDLLGTGSASTLSGLPFTSASSTSEGGFNVAYFSGFAVNVIQPVLGVNASSTNCTVYSRTTAGTSSSAVSIFGNTARLFFYGHYQVA